MPQPRSDRIPLIGPLSDPNVRRERARRARAAQTTLDYHIRKLVESAGALTPEQAEQLRALLATTGGEA